MRTSYRGPAKLPPVTVIGFGAEAVGAAKPPSSGRDPAQTSLAVDSFATEESYGAASEQQTSALAAATAEANAAPQAAPTLDAPDDITGVVAGSLNATDADGDALTYAVTGAPTGGTVTVDQAGTFVYTLTQATRLKAGSTAGGDIDSFTVTISDGQTTTAVPVTVAVSNEVTSVDSPITVGTNPTGVATTTTATGTYTYVANQSSNIVSVIDSNNEVVSTITVGSAPTGVAASPDGSKVYVTNRSTGKLSVIDTNTNKVVSTITVGSAPTGVPFTSEILDRCEQIMREACADFGAQLHEFNGETDHVHLLVHYPPKVAL
jgi:YVTN family beta-propeller protein/VCBS repeat-containing protein